MRRYQAPAKVNLSLHVFPLGDDGYHPLESLVQTLEWCDDLEVEGADEWSLEVVGAEIDDDENLVTRGFAEMGVVRVAVKLTKSLPVAAGLGGGSSDGAAALVASTSFGGDRDAVRPAAAKLGADVPMFLDGGTQMMMGRGEVLERGRQLSGFALAIVVPDLHVSTAGVYRRWDEMEGPSGEVPPDDSLPPELRDSMPLRNDLLPAALAVEPGLGDFMADVRRVWGRPALLTGSGPSCFGFFNTVDEASDAARAIGGTRAARGVALRDHGISEVPRTDN